MIIKEADSQTAPGGKKAPEPKETRPLSLSFLCDGAPKRTISRLGNPDNFRRAARLFRGSAALKEIKKK